MFLLAKCGAIAKCGGIPLGSMEHGSFIVHDSPRPHPRARAGLAQQRPKRSSGSSGRRPSSFRTPPASPRASRKGNEIHGATTSRLCRFPSTDPCFPCGASVLHDRRTVDVLQQLQQTRRLQPFRTVSMPNSDLSRFQIHTTWYIHKSEAAVQT